MNALVEAIAEGWTWKFGKPVAVIATNCFGNAIVKNETGHYYRIMPEEWSCDLLATSADELEVERKSEAFVRDWEMAALVERARAVHGPLAEGEVYYLVIPGMLGGTYSEENIRKIPLLELLSYSGSMAEQVDDLPPGAEVIIKPVGGKGPTRR